MYFTSNNVYRSLPYSVLHSPSYRAIALGRSLTWLYLPVSLQPPSVTLSSEDNDLDLGTLSSRALTCSLCCLYLHSVCASLTYFKPTYANAMLQICHLKVHTYITNIILIIWQNGLEDKWPESVVEAQHNSFVKEKHLLFSFPPFHPLTSKKKKKAELVLMAFEPKEIRPNWKFHCK